MEEIEEKQDELECPVCEGMFADMRGLTSHARHKHDMSRDELVALIHNPEDNSNGFLKVLGGVGSVLLVLITMGRMR